MRLRRIKQKEASDMFLDKIVGFFTNRRMEQASSEAHLTNSFADNKKVSAYSDTILNEFEQHRNSGLALDASSRFAIENKMSNDEIKIGREQAANKLEFRFKKLTDITERDFDEVTKLFNNLHLEPTRKNEIFKNLFKHYLLLMAGKGTPHEFDKTKMPLSIVYKNGEKLYFLGNAINVKKRKKTVGVNFAGPVASIRICKGVRYRIGSMNVQRQTVENYDNSDQGMFYITNMRIGYLGKTQFSFNLNKLVSLQNGEAGLLLYKEGRQNPFMIALDDYDVPCTILSTLLNQ